MAVERRVFPDQGRCAGCGKGATGFVKFRGLTLGVDHAECRMKVARAMPARHATDELEVRTVPFAGLNIRSIDDGAGAFEGYANLFKARDTYETRFMPGAWSKGGLDKEPYPLLWMHSPYDPVGVLNAVEDSKGLAVEGRWDNTDEGKRARGRAESSAPELSVGFKTKQRSKDDPRDIQVSELREVSQVTARWGSTPGARLVGVRMATGTSTRAVDGSYEDLQEDLREAIQNQFGGGAPYGCYVVATFADHVIYINGGDMDDDDAYQVAYTVAEDGSISFGQPEAVEIGQVVQPRAKEVSQAQLQLRERRRLATLLQLDVPVLGGIVPGIEARAADDKGDKNSTKDTAANRKAWAAAGYALKDGSFPVLKCGTGAFSVDAAVHSMGRGDADTATIKAHIIKNAKRLGCSDELPDDWK